MSRPTPIAVRPRSSEVPLELSRVTGWRMGRWARVGVLALVGCGGSRPAEAPTGAGGAECPAGQTFDGQFCRVEGELAQSEPLPMPPAETAPEPEPVSTAEVPAPTSGSGGAGSESAESDVPGAGGELTSAAQATPVDVSMAAQAGPAITYLAGSHLPPGAQPLGAPFAAQFAEGQVFEQKVQLTLGRCYTIVAAGIPPVRDVNIELFEDGGEEPVARDDAVGPQAVLGSRNQCFKPQRPDMKLVVSVAKGQGVVAGQVFEK